MPWQTLPYHLLELIFDYASHPLAAENFAPNPSSFWLLRMAKLCRGFAEPALTVLYTSPPLFPPTRVEGLITTLSAQDEKSFMNYRAKIRNIDVEAVEILNKRTDAGAWVLLWGLLPHVPKLQRIGIHLLSDNAKYQHRLANRRIGYAAYAADLLDHLNHAKVQLREWIWNQDLQSPGFRTSGLAAIHLSPPFQTIQSLKIVNSLQVRVLDQPVGMDLEQALKALPNLRHLSFWRADILDHMDLSRLPEGLHTLEIIDSPIESIHVDAFLRANGRSLTTLILDHNQHLNLSWMQGLAEYCPKLEHLKMDLIYHSPFIVVSNIEPQYDALLEPFETPTWPTKLHTIELYHLRKWSVGAAGNFLQSLVDASSTLSDLRTIRIKASINESGWRERKDFKDKWIETLDKVFRYDSPPPNPNWTSIPAFKGWKTRQQPFNNNNKIKVQIPMRSARAVNGADNANGITNAAGDGDSDSDKPIAQRRRTRASAASPSRRTIDSPSPSPSSSSSPSTPSSETGEHFITSPSDPSAQTLTLTKMKPKTPFIQGKCDIVDLKIDSQRPTEEQLHESDFLDAEVSGDEDWNGDGDDDFEGEDGGYAW